jgi:endonuclease III
MNPSQRKIVQILIERGDELLKQPYEKLEFTGDQKADDLLNNLEKFPHAFVLACIMDRQIKAEKAWLIPYEVSKEIGGFEFAKLAKLTQSDIHGIFKRKNLHRFNNMMASSFFEAIKRIQNEYNSNAADIWNDRQGSATIVRRFMRFNGVKIKIATMATNILARDFKIPMTDYISIDISPDRHVRRVFKRLGFTLDEENIDDLIYCARELNPFYPGIFDLACWEIGREWCKPDNPTCTKCYLFENCPRNLGLH